MKNKDKYKAPKIVKTKFKINFFYSDSRYLDSLNMLQTSNLLSASSSSVDTCFMPDTKVLMENGKTKQIQEIKVKDIVVSYNLVGNVATKNSVESIIVKTYIDGYLEINNLLKITLNHKVWVNNTDWIEARDVKVGDTFLNSNGENIQVETIQHVKGTYTVYNLHLNGTEHNFFAENILVHNGVDTADCS